MKIGRTIKKYATNPRRLIYLFGVYGWLNWLPDKLYLKMVYWGEIGKKLNLENPKTYNEKLQWLKLYDRKSEYSTFVDKYAVRSHIAKKIGKHYLIPLFDVYDSVEEIDWNTLPEKFILKCTHASGANIICTDKNKLNIEEVQKKLKRWLKKNWYWYGREWPYKNIKPRIICEYFLSDTDNTPDDYKVLCFNGKAKLIQLHIDRYGSHKQDFYDIEWNKRYITQGFENSEIVYKEPKQLKEMIRLSELLSTDIMHVRVDWFIIKERLYFGEMTFFDGSGWAPFDNEKYDYLLGKWIDLDNSKCK